MSDTTTTPRTPDRDDEERQLDAREVERLRQLGFHRSQLGFTRHIRPVRDEEDTETCLTMESLGRSD